MTTITCIEDLRVLARKRVPRMFYDYADSGSWTESTYRANESDFQKILLRQRVAVNMENRSTRTTMIGQDAAMPVAIAPTGMTGMQHADGEILAVHRRDDADAQIDCAASDLAVNPSPVHRAARSGDPVLFADAESLPAATAKALRRYADVPVYVLGPSSAISSDVFREIAKIDGKVKRVSGESPVENAIAFARYSAADFGWNINDPGHGFVLARAESPLDAAAAAALSASGTWGPLLLTDSAASLPAELRSYFLDVKPGYTTNPTRAFYNHVWVIGDQEAIDMNQQAEVNGLAELAKIESGEP